MIVLWFNARRRVNLSFAAFALGTFVWMVGTFAARMYVAIPQLGGSPVLMLEVAASGFAIVGVALFWFVSAFYSSWGRYMRRIIAGFQGLGLLFLIVGIWLLFSGQAVHDPFLRPGGQLSYVIEPVGQMLGGVHFLYDLLALALLIYQRQLRQNWYLVVGTTLVFVSSLATLVDWQLPIQTFGMVFAVLFVTYEVFKQQVFNPLLINQKFLEQEIERRSHELRTSLVAQERMRQELNVAHQIQVDLLPQEIPAHPRFTLAAISLPAREVGGDFYAHALRSQRYLSLAVGDVSGKGIPAALLMALIVNTFDTFAAIHLDQGLLLSDLNQILYPRLSKSKLNAGLCSLVLDVETRMLQVSNAGLIAPLLWRKGSVRYLEVTGLPLGALANNTYKQINEQLEFDDRLLILSDGLVEVRNAQGELWGFDRLESTLAAYGHLTPQQLMQYLLDQVNSFADQTPPQDDITLIVVHIH